MDKERGDLDFLIHNSWLRPTRKRLATALVCSLAVHLLGYIAYRVTPAVGLAYDISEIKFVDADFDHAILLNLSRPLRYPGQYPGFGAPAKTLDLEAMKKIEKKKLEEEARRKAAEEAKKKEEAEKQLAKNSEPKAPEAAATPKPAPSGFKPINTRPIREQIQRLYDLNQEGKLVVDEQMFKVGVQGEIKADGEIVNSRVFIPSGNAQIDLAAIAIIQAVSESRALGPLSQLTSLSMILTVDTQKAELVTVGFAPDQPTADNLQNAAQAAVFLGKRLKAADPASMIFLNNIKIAQTGNRLTATITVPRQVAKDTLASTMIKRSQTNQ